MGMKANKIVTSYPQNVSAPKMSKASPTKGAGETPRVGGHTSNRTPTQGVPGGFGRGKGGC